MLGASSAHGQIIDNDPGLQAAENLVVIIDARSISRPRAPALCLPSTTVTPISQRCSMWSDSPRCPGEDRTASDLKSGSATTRSPTSRRVLQGSRPRQRAGSDPRGEGPRRQLQLCAPRRHGTSENGLPAYAIGQPAKDWASLTPGPSATSVPFGLRSSRPTSSTGIREERFIDQQGVSLAWSTRPIGLRRICCAVVHALDVLASI